MRSDMYKVIVERPRKGKYAGTEADRRRKDFDGPSHLGMRSGIGYRSLNENLNPLKRFLRAQVGRPWNKVYSEISAGIDRRNTVQLHILAHLDGMIAVQAGWRNGELVDLKDRYGRYGREKPGMRQELYVDPRTGLIRPNKSYRSWNSERRAKAKLDAEELATRVRHVDQDMQLMRIEGQWYEVSFADVPPAKEIEYMRGGAIHRRQRFTWVYDVVLRKKVCGREEKRYAVSKRQLSRREIADCGLPREATS
jgi:hypothetical protein